MTEQTRKDIRENTQEYAHGDKLRILLIVPAYNEELNVPLFVQEAESQLKAYDWQILFVDDGSKDRTWNAIKQMGEVCAKVGGLRLARNFGHQNALKAGLLEACSTNADLFLTLDADLQHPLSLIPSMIKEWQNGNASIVQTVRDDTERRISAFKKWTSRAFYHIFSLLSGIPMRPGMSDFRLIDRDCMRFIISCNDTDFFLRGLLPWSGLNTVYLPYKPAERVHGHSKFTFKKMAELALNGIVGYSTRPLFFAIFLGLISIVVSCAYFVYVIAMTCIGGNVAVGWPSIISLVLGLGGLILFVMGILGIYIGKLYMESKGRPTFVVGEKLTSKYHIFATATDRDK